MYNTFSEILAILAVLYRKGAEGKNYSERLLQENSSRVIVCKRLKEESMSKYTLEVCKVLIGVALCKKVSSAALHAKIFQDY